MSQAVSDPRIEAQDIDFLGIAVRAHRGVDSVVCEFVAPPGPLAPPHRHGWAETHYVIEGEIEYMVAGAIRRLGTGSFLTIPASTLHALTAVTPVRWIEISPDDRPAQFFAQVSREANELPPDMEKLVAIAAQHEVSVDLG